MFTQFPLTHKKDFDWKDLHKQIGRIVVIEPGESDFAEGNFKTQIWFQTETTIYLLDEFEQAVKEK